MSGKNVEEKIKELLQELEDLNLDQLLSPFVDYGCEEIASRISELDKDQQKKAFKQVRVALSAGKALTKAWSPVNEFMESGEWNEAEDGD